MLILAVAAATAALWLWLLPPVGLSRRARATWIACLLVSAGVSGWMTAQVMAAADGARQRAGENARRVREEQSRTLDRVRDALGPDVLGR